MWSTCQDWGRATGTGPEGTKIPKIDTTAEPGLEKRETWGTPGFSLSTFTGHSRYSRAGDVGHPPARILNAS
jgi:hypothetical protein